MKEQGDTGFVSKEKQILLFHPKKGKLVGLFLLRPAVELVTEHQVQGFGISFY